MSCYADCLRITNLALCLGILLVGCWAYAKTKEKTPFQLGVAFGLFAVSHLITFLGMEKVLSLTIILIRVFGYLIVLATVYKMGIRR